MPDYKSMDVLLGVWDFAGSMSLADPPVVSPETSALSSAGSSTDVCSSVGYAFAAMSGARCTTVPLNARHRSDDVSLGHYGTRPFYTCIGEREQVRLKISICAAGARPPTAIEEITGAGWDMYTCPTYSSAENLLAVEFG